MPRNRPKPEKLQVTIPTMEWQQIGGDIDPGRHGGTIATADGHSVELIKIQPVREYVGDDEARDVGFPFWTRTAYFDAADLDSKNKDVQGALQFISMDERTLEEEYDPEQRALIIAEALLDYGHADEGPAGWSGDIGIPEAVKWWGGKVAGPEYIADEDEIFAKEVLLADLNVDHESYGPDEQSPTNGLHVVANDRDVEITEWTDVEDATGDEQPDGERILRRSATVDLDELFSPSGKHRGAYSGDRGDVTIMSLAQMDDDDRQKAVVAAAIAYMAYHGGEEEFVDRIGD